MKVKQFLGKYNIGRSNISNVIVVDVEDWSIRYIFSRKELMDNEYGECGNFKINTFTINEDLITIYAENA